MPPFNRQYHLEVQVNDVIQVNLNEITNLKHDLACTEEKMVYQSYERSRDIWVRIAIPMLGNTSPSIYVSWYHWKNKG